MLSRHPTLFLAMFSWPPGCLRPFNKLRSPRFGLGTQCVPRRLEFDPRARTGKDARQRKFHALRFPVELSIDAYNSHFNTALTALSAASCINVTCQRGARISACHRTSVEGGRTPGRTIHVSASPHSRIYNLQVPCISLGRGICGSMRRA